MTKAKRREYFTRRSLPGGLCLFCRKMTQRRVTFKPGAVHVALCRTCEKKADMDGRMEIVIRLMRSLKDLEGILNRDGLDTRPPKTANMPHLPYEEYVKLAGRELALSAKSLIDGICKDQQIQVCAGFIPVPPRHKT